MARTDPQINLRIPEELKSVFEEQAQKNHRSLTQEIVHTLDKSLTKNYIHEYNDLNEPMMSVHLKDVTIGLLKSQYPEIKLQKNFNNTNWTLSYYGLRCTIDSKIAKELFDKGCTIVP